VEPIRLVTIGRRWYLVAWDIDRADWRTFRVDRLTEPRSTRFRFEPREVPGGDAAAFVARELASMPARYSVVLEIRTAAVDVERVVGHWGAVEPIDSGTCRLRMDVDSLEWPIAVLAALGADFQVIEPSALRDYLRRTGESFLRSAS
jgi:predicted DNA-binding transcriptional regulator YafY